MPYANPIPHDTIVNKVLPALINGQTGKSIADEIGVTQPTISKWKAKLADQLQAYQFQLLDKSGQATVNNITATIDRANKVLTNKDDNGDYTTKSVDLSDYKDLLQLSHKKEVLVAQAMGILPTHAQSITINQIINNDNRTLMSPAMANLMQSQVAAQQDEDDSFELIDNDVDSQEPTIIDV